MSTVAPTSPDVPSLAMLLTMLGFGQNAAAIASIIVAVLMIVAHILPWLPVPATGSRTFYAVVYSIFSKATGGYANTTPVPDNEKLPATK